MAQTQGQPQTMDMREQVKTLHGEELLKFLQKVHPSDAHLLMRDHMTEKQHTALRKGSLELKKLYYQIKENASRSYERDHTVAKMKDVDQGCTNVYTICLRMIKQQQEDINHLQDVINEMRVAQGQQPIDWYPPEVDPNAVTPQSETQADGLTNGTDKTKLDGIGTAEAE